MAQSTPTGPLSTVYEDRIGTATSANEVTGYWAFLAGVIVGLLGLVVYFLTEPATMARGVGYAMAALAPALLMTGAVLRFPLRNQATYLTGAGLLLVLAAVTWFLVVFPSGWSTATGNTGVIVTYVAGLAVIGIAAAAVPVVTDPRLAEAEREAEAANEAAAAAQQDAAALAQANEAAARAQQKAAALANANKSAADAREDLLQTEIKGLEEDGGDIGSSNADFELYTDVDEQWRWRLVHDNGNIIADGGQGYTSKANARQGLVSVKLNAIGAETVEAPR